MHVNEKNLPMNLSRFPSSNPQVQSITYTFGTTRQRYAISHFTENFTIGVSCNRGDGGECMIFRDRMGKERKEGGREWRLEREKEFQTMTPRGRTLSGYDPATNERAAGRENAVGFTAEAIEGSKCRAL